MHYHSVPSNDGADTGQKTEVRNSNLLARKPVKGQKREKRGQKSHCWASFSFVSRQKCIDYEVDLRVRKRQSSHSEKQPTEICYAAPMTLVRHRRLMWVHWGVQLALFQDLCQSEFLWNIYGFPMEDGFQWLNLSISQGTGTKDSLA